MSKQHNILSQTTSDCGTSPSCENRHGTTVACRQPRVLLHLVVLFSIMVVAMILIYCFFGPTMVEKILTSLAMPMGLIWLFLFFQGYVSFLLGQIKMGIFTLAIWTLITLGGNAWVSDFLISSLEKPFYELDPFQMEKLDTVIVLGGGTSARLSGQPQFGEGGDRVGLAARLYHAGKVERIVCTGSATFQKEKELQPREQAAAILISLGIPKENVVKIEGLNTSQEMISLKEFSQQSDLTDKRVGVITSACHLPRALRLAKNNGLELVPVPADFRTRPFRIDPDMIVPSASQMSRFQLAAKEYLARLVNR